jgi:hypothetical protein
MNQYEVTFTNGEVVVIAAGTAEAAQAIADESADLYGCVGLSAVSAMLLESAVVGPSRAERRQPLHRPAGGVQRTVGRQ